MFKEERAMETQHAQHASAPKEIRTLLQGAMAIFVITVVIGMLNGMDLVEFDRKALLTHLHSGTLGWITLGVFAAAFQLFRSSSEAQSSSQSATRWLAPAAILAVLFYVIAFYTTFGIWRAIAGSFMLLVILGVFTWVLRQGGRVNYRIPHLAILGAMINLVIGAVVGVLLGLQLAGRLTGLPAGARDAHAGAMIAGYVILAGMAIVEWKLVRDPKPAGRDRWGIAQVALMFLAGLVLSIGLLMNQLQLVQLNVPLMVVGTIIFLGRIGRTAVKQKWAAATSGRLFAISILFLVTNITLLAYVINLVISAGGDIEAVPLGLALAMDHALFIGVIANLNFGMIYDVTVGRRAIWSWVDQVLFWGMNVGLIGFLVGLILESAAIKQIATPIMGTSILLAILTYTVRLQTRPGELARS
jgi:hypothetical protein